MRILENLEPKKVFYYFEELSKIPHGSGNMQKVSNWLVDFAKERNLEVIQDKSYNVIIIKEATPGYETKEPVILQGHIDMVCEKDADCTKDMENEGLDLALEGDLVFAKGTTLGADNGIAVAMMMAVLDADNLKHPRIEAVFTVDEEIGLLGASAIDLSMLKGKKLLNIDSEVEGIFTVSCAGGNMTKCTIPVARDDFDGETVKISIEGLKGGHSGIEIDKGRANADILMGRVLYKISQACELRIVSVNGGVKDNVISGKSECIAKVSSKKAVDDVISAMQEAFQNEYRVTDPDIEISVDLAACEKPLNLESTKNVVRMLTLLPNGVVEMSADIDDLVQTSLNLGVVKTTDNEFITGSCVRSSKETQKEMLCEKIAVLAESLGGKIEIFGDYPGWDYRADSPLRDLMIEVFKNQYGYEPKVEAIHAGLECGILASKITDLDCISFGPNLTDIHSPREKMSVSSVERVWKMVVDVLEKMR